MVIKIFVWDLYDDFYMHCYFQKLFSLYKGIMCMFGGWIKVCGDWVCTF